MRELIAEHFPMLAMWLSIGIGITDRKGPGGSVAAASSTKRNVILVMRAR